jgi:hypothetical protein
VDIRERVDAFVSELETLIRDAIRDGFAKAMGDLPTAKRGPGRPPGSGRAAAPAAVGGRKRKKGAKRSPAELKRIEETLLSFIQKTPGKRIEEINATLGTTTADLSRPLSKLIAAKKVRRQGQKRASRYFPAGK